MNSLRQIFAIAIADFRERSRRYSFWVFLIFITYLAYLYVPALDAPYTSLSLGGYRGVYNSHWVGAQVTLLTISMATLVGFFFVRGSISREYINHTNELIASSSASNFAYLSGKAIGNALILYSMTAILAGTSAIMQLARAEDVHFNLFALQAPFVIVILPLMLAVACLAVFFETIPLLRGGIGNAAFIFLWIIMFVNLGISSNNIDPAFDMFGSVYLFKQLMAGCAAANPDYVPWEGPHSFGFNFHVSGTVPPLKTFFWNGPHWSATFLVSRVILVGLSVLIIAVASKTFRRFDERQKVLKSKSRKKEAVNDSAPVTKEAEFPAPKSMGHLTKLESAPGKLRYFGLIIAELKLALSGISLWWLLIAAGIFAAGMFTPFQIAYAFLLPAAWFWPLLIWSKMGCRDELFGTQQIIQSTQAGIFSRLSAQWFAGFVVALVCGAFIGLRALISGETDIAAHWLIGAAFIPSLALVGGSLTGGRKFFEVIYTLLWYIGPLNKMPYLDFSGSADGVVVPKSSVIWLIVTVGLFLVAYAAKKFRAVRQ